MSSGLQNPKLSIEHLSGELMLAQHRLDKVESDYGTAALAFKAKPYAYNLPKVVLHAAEMLEAQAYVDEVKAELKTRGEAP